MSLILHFVEESQPLRIVFDTNIWISATNWNESVSRKLFEKSDKDTFDIFISLEMIEEYERVMLRDFAPNELTNAFSKRIKATTIIIQPIEKIEIVQADPDDNKIIECAVAANANYIITYDPHLLNLKEFRGIKIVKPEEFLKILK